MDIACLDLEGVLVPEIWIEMAKRTGIDELKATTRDIPDYDVLMQQRLAILQSRGLGLGDIQSVISAMTPLDGAEGFLDWLRTHFQVAILSGHLQLLAPGHDIHDHKRLHTLRSARNHLVSPFTRIRHLFRRSLPARAALWHDEGGL